MWQSILVSREKLRDEGTCSIRETHPSPHHEITTGSRDVHDLEKDLVS